LGLEGKEKIDNTETKPSKSAERGKDQGNKVLVNSNSSEYAPGRNRYKVY
jgi:hypothetical protein